MDTLKWDNDTEPSGDRPWYSEARASHAVRGRYRITYLPGGYKNWRGNIVEPLFDIKFRRSNSRNWQHLGLRNTLNGAVWEAEQDHAARQQNGGHFGGSA
jgi:hypothetical protein